MAFDPRVTENNRIHLLNAMDDPLSEIENKKTKDAIEELLFTVVQYADDEDENVIEEARNIPIVDDPEDRLSELEATVEQLRHENIYLLSKADELEAKYYEI
ncbi:uL4 family ribosomal protein [Weissella paramesenteroides]|uniref:uL4 family ribosomal protein n=1 Tax=Weissella paramesenteroides TaxID=1249 RepID=UPI00223B90FF|nr:uL4 family ribosomal protein [Weissella paramesenteroides]MCT0485955.1 hypothetical protein [Weissella paramesenteroides]